MKIAILITSFNRKEKTLACLKNIITQEILEGVELEVFLTDDGSSDGTAEEVKKQFPKVNVFLGTGSLYWAGGMRKAWKEAITSKPDYYLLLNDDTFLYPNALNTVLQASIDYHAEKGILAISVGTTTEPNSTEITYGGSKLYAQWRPQCYLIQPGTQYIECDIANSNIMLVPAAIVDKIGILSEDFTHGIADYDYTLRTRKAGFTVIVAPGILGTCADDHDKSWKPVSVKLSDRIKYMYSVKGLAYHEYLLFIKRHFPWDLPASIFKLWLKTLFPFVYDLLKK